MTKKLIETRELISLRVLLADKGACREVGGDVWFPEQGEPCNVAKKVCEGCEVRTECLTYSLALPEEHGVWGGLSPRERQALRLKPRWIA